MDAEQKPLHPALVFAKTAKGTAEIATRSGTLSLPMRRILIMIDGKRALRELLPYVRTGELEKIMSALEASGMIEATGHAGGSAAEQAAPPDAEPKAADAAAATERRATAAPVVPVTHPGPPATVNVPLGAATLETPAPRPVTVTGVVRPATLSGTPASPMPGSVSRPPMSNGAPRPPTLNGTPRPATLSESRGVAAAAQLQAQIPNAQPRPPALSGASTAQKSPPPTLSGAARPPTLGGNGGKAAAPAPAQPVSQAASPAAAAAEPVSLEDSKRKAVRELYDRLGPYGEEPAARIQSCTTLDALREELRYAGKRVATFRDQKAAEEYLASMARVALGASA